MEIEPGQGSIALPADEAPFGRGPPPLDPPNANRIGLG
jgi:hypothetical protein